MIDKKEQENCCGCGACADVCKMKAIRMIRDEEGFSYPRIDKKLCINCGRCKSTCPISNHNEQDKVRKKLYFGVQARSEELRYSSSSGGLFSLLAQYVLRQGGVVYGAGYDADMNVMHKEIDMLEELEQIKRTKYVQSDMTGIYVGIEKRLREGRWVLFCGTPCQAQALTLFLRRKYDKLIVVDLVCYGVPSPGIWRDYVSYLERKYRGKMTDFSFRDKRNRDNGHICSYRIGGKEYVESIYQNVFCRLYFHNLILRPSCHRCRFCNTDRGSDFTIGDFWGIERVRPDMDDGLGTSMGIAHTEKARKIWEETEKDSFWFECAKKDLLQPRLVEPTGMSRERSAFMTWYRFLPFSFTLHLTNRKMNRRRILK